VVFGVRRCWYLGAGWYCSCALVIGLVAEVAVDVEVWWGYNESRSLQLSHKVLTNVSAGT